MILRRRFIAAALGATVLPMPAGLAAAKPTRIGWVVGSTRAATQPFLVALREGYAA
jgi:ABC-type sugar transport system substrate-binding protein